MLYQQMTTWEEERNKMAWEEMPPSINSYEPGALLIFYPDEVASIKEFLLPNIKDKVFYDVGCFIGIWSVIALLAGAREIHLFDPSPSIEDAKKNVRNAGSVPIFSTQKSMNNRDTIDDYCSSSPSPSPPGFIKIDTEGAEIAILQGAQETISRHHPMLMVENHAGPERDLEIISLAGEGYKCAPIKDLNNHRHVFLY